MARRRREWHDRGYWWRHCQTGTLDDGAHGDGRHEVRASQCLGRDGTAVSRPAVGGSARGRCDVDDRGLLSSAVTLHSEDTSEALEEFVWA